MQTQPPSVPVKLVASGIVSGMGVGLDEHQRCIQSGQNRYSKRQLTNLKEPIEVCYADVESCRQLDTTNKIHSFLDTCLNELLDQQPLTRQQRRDIPLFIGSSSYGIGIAEDALQQQRHQQPDQQAFAIPLDGLSQITDHLRQQHHFGGADYVFNSACTSSANALLSACQILQAGRCDYALVIGIETYNITTLAGFSALQLLTHKAMQPFDLHRQGMMLGEGCSLLLLKANESTPGLYFSGGSSRCDTHSIAASNVDGSAMAAVMQEAMAENQLTDSDIVAIKAHGTASPLNDKGEAAAMQQTFATIPPFFSLKGYLGHSLGACAAIELALTANCLSKGIIPASAGFKETDPELRISPLQHIISANEGHYLFNFFGFGGNNVSLIFEQRLTINES